MLAHPGLRNAQAGKARLQAATRARRRLACALYPNSASAADRDRPRVEFQRRLPPAYHDLAHIDLRLFAIVRHAPVLEWQQPAQETRRVAATVSPAPTRSWARSSGRPGVALWVQRDRPSALPVAMDKHSMRRNATGTIAGVSDGLARARLDLAAGRPWRARNRLNGVLAHRQDLEVLDLLATVHHEMQDLPAAGALWFVIGRGDDAAQRSISAWLEQHRNDLARWHSIPAPVRRKVSTEPLEGLRRAAGQADKGGTRDLRPRVAEPEAWWEPIVFGGGAIIVVVWLLAMVGIGMWTVFRWIWN